MLNNLIILYAADRMSCMFPIHNSMIITPSSIIITTKA